MYWFHKKRQAKGLTLVELLVSLFLTTVVITIVFFIYLSTSRAYLRWEAESSYTDCARLIIKSLTNTIADGVALISADDSSLEIEQNNLKTDAFEINSEGRLYKNGVALNPEDISVTELNFKYAVKDSSVFTLRIWISLMRTVILR
jgi:Tfp pilus assembly protein PilW